MRKISLKNNLSVIYGLLFCMAGSYFIIPFVSYDSVHELELMWRDSVEVTDAIVTDVTEVKPAISVLFDRRKNEKIDYKYEIDSKHYTGQSYFPAGSDLSSNKIGDKIKVRYLPEKEISVASGGRVHARNLAEIFISIPFGLIGFYLILSILQANWRYAYLQRKGKLYKGKVRSFKKYARYLYAVKIIIYEANGNERIIKSTFYDNDCRALDNIIKQGRTPTFLYAEPSRLPGLNYPAVMLSEECALENLVLAEDTEQLFENPDITKMHRHLKYITVITGVGWVVFLSTLSYIYGDKSLAKFSGLILGWFVFSICSLIAMGIISRYTQCPICNKYNKIEKEEEEKRIDIVKKCKYCGAIFTFDLSLL